MYKTCEDILEYVEDGYSVYKYSVGRVVIYKILNNKTDDFYIGMSTNFHRRISSHLDSLSRGTHCNYNLQNAFDEYGLENFSFIVVEEFDNDFSSEELRKVEARYITKLQPKYNIQGVNSKPQVVLKEYYYGNGELNLQKAFMELIIKAANSSKTLSEAAKKLKI